MGVALRRQQGDSTGLRAGRGSEQCVFTDSRSLPGAPSPRCWTVGQLQDRSRHVRARLCLPQTRNRLQSRREAPGTLRRELSHLRAPHASSSTSGSGRPGHESRRSERLWLLTTGEEGKEPTCLKSFWSTAKLPCKLFP